MRRRRRSCRRSGNRRRHRTRGLLGSRFRRVRGNLIFSGLPKMLTHQFGMLDIQGTGVRLFFADSDFGQVVDQDFCLDLKFPS